MVYWKAAFLLSDFGFMDQMIYEASLMWPKERDKSTGTWAPSSKVIPINPLSTQCHRWSASPKNEVNVVQKHSTSLSLWGGYVERETSLDANKTENGQSRLMETRGKMPIWPLADAQWQPQMPMSKLEQRPDFQCSPRNDPCRFVLIPVFESKPG